ncbi:MAG: hypothetical protein AAFQ43_08255 [Bacteroidota bacterium]
MTRADRDLLVFHGLFAAVAVGGLLLPVGPIGWRVLILVVLYNVALPLWARARGHSRAFGLWRFLVPLSLFQVVPDAFLADVLGVLVFPDTGGPRLGSVSLALAGMWTIPLFAIAWIAGRVEEGRGATVAGWTAAGLALVGFGAAEATLWVIPIWYTQGVAQIGAVALFVLAPEALLGATTYLAERETRDRGPLAQVGAAGLVALVYLGALGASYWFFEAA